MKKNVLYILGALSFSVMLACGAKTTDATASDTLMVDTLQKEVVVVDTLTIIKDTVESSVVTTESKAARDSAANYKKQK